MAEEVPRTTNSQALRRLSSDQEDWDSMKRSKRGKCSFLKPQDSSLSICKNPACEATQSTVPGLCKRCCCCICCRFDNNMDPSLWLKCTPESGSEGSCGSSCHAECALSDMGWSAMAPIFVLHVVKFPQFWKKQLEIAMDSKHVDILCYRIFLNYRLLKGTSRFCELHKFIEDLKCKLAIQKAEELQTSNSSSLLNLSEGSVSDSVHRYKNRADVESDSREKLVQKRGKEPQSGGKCMGVGAPDTKTSIAAVEKSQGLDEDFENIVRIIRGLEHGGHVSMEFRLKFLTWFSLKAREHERRVVRTFMKTMIDDPNGLAGQLVDAFSAIIFCNRP
ncbi:hypothetical protein SASPL_106028 [Salvia splendens]|uniref:VIN3-like protein 1 n=1 Tax=Salvia splendens TaxID=180675 RepID=A0A8X9A9V3_SALSN|nr:hypothetical protein SASPL_106028 [Salvia splendens]